MAILISVLFSWGAQTVLLMVLLGGFHAGLEPGQPEAVPSPLSHLLSPHSCLSSQSEAHALLCVYSASYLILLPRFSGGREERKTHAPPPPPQGPVFVSLDSFTGPSSSASTWSLACTCPGAPPNSPAACNLQLPHSREDPVATTPPASPQGTQLRTAWGAPGGHSSCPRFFTPSISLQVTSSTQLGLF